MLHEIKASPETIHWGYYDASIKPVLRIKPGDSVIVETVTLPIMYSSDLASLGLDEEKIPKEYKRIYHEFREKGPGPHILTGPILVEGAEPRDVLEVTIEKVELPLPFGYNVIIPSAGTLPEDYPYSNIKIIKFDLEDMMAGFSRDIEIPLKPFFGSMGVAPPPIRGRISSRPPGFHGGNLDNKELVEGSKLYLPIHAEGALFSIGDGHAFQGDGEVNSTAVEASMRGTIRFKVKKDMELKWPLGETPTHIISMGFHEDLDEAIRMALRNMIDYLTMNKGLDHDEAYILSSIAVDFHITQTVNRVKGVHGLLPKDIFKKN
ncbi:MAG: acetamidase/formamidase family protein [Promethearchaeota archaeon]|jgi:acetamidase/formamidase